MAQWESSTNQLNNQGLGQTQHETSLTVDKSGNVLAVPYGSGANHQISAGNVTGYEAIHRCGRINITPSNTANVFLSIYDLAGVHLSYAIHDSAGLYNGGTGLNLTAFSSSVNDTGSIRLQGLDANWDFLQEDVTLYGTTEGTKTSNKFIRLDKAFLQTAAGAADSNVGVINIYEDGDSDGYFGRMEIGHAETFNAFYTVPRNKTGYITNMEVSSHTAVASSIYLFVQEFGGMMRARHEMNIEKGQQSIEFPCPIKVPQKSDIELRHKGPINSSVTASFDLIVVDN